MYGYSRIKNCHVIVVKNLFFLSVPLATLSLPPCVQTFFYYLYYVLGTFDGKFKLYFNKKNVNESVMDFVWYDVGRQRGN